MRPTTASAWNPASLKCEQLVASRILGEEQEELTPTHSYCVVYAPEIMAIGGDLLE